MAETIYDPEVDTDVVITLGSSEKVQGGLNERPFEVAILYGAADFIGVDRRFRGKVTEGFRYERDERGVEISSRQIPYATITFERHPEDADKPPLSSCEDTTNHQITGDPAAVLAVGTAVVSGLIAEQARSQAIG